MNKINWSELVEYDESSPSCLRWKVEIRTGKNRNVALTFPGMPAGTKALRKNGTAMWWQLGYEGKKYRLHRIVYELLFGNIENCKYIDHIDGNPFNNRFNNLRLVDPKTNSRNMKKHNRGGDFAGVCFENTHNNCKYYVSYFVDLNGKLKRKRFSVKKLGRELAELCAIEYRDRAIRLLNLSGAGYSERHGK